MPTVLVTGCDTGLGREFALQYRQAGYDVVATYRDIANRLPEQDGMRHLALDVTEPAQLDAVKRAIGDAPIDVLLSNAGIGRDLGVLGKLDFAFVERVLAVNTIGPLRLVETFVENVAASTERKLVLISSRMGSISANLSGGHYAYRASKAGLNAIGRSLALDLFRRGIIVTMLHPGWVGTAAGGDGAPITAAQSVAAMREIVRRLGNHETGQFYAHTGNGLPW